MSVPSRTDFWGGCTYYVIRQLRIKRACSTLGVELTAKKKEAVWDVDDSYVSRLRTDEGDDEAYDPDIVHTLHIQRVSKLCFTACSHVIYRSFLDQMLKMRTT